MTIRGMERWWRHNCSGNVYYCDKCKRRHWRDRRIGKLHNITLESFEDWLKSINKQTCNIYQFYIYLSKKHPYKKNRTYMEPTKECKKWLIEFWKPFYEKYVQNNLEELGINSVGVIDWTGVVGTFLKKGVNK